MGRSAQARPGIGRRRDRAADSLSVVGARRYGVVLGGDLAVDDDATRKLREAMAAERGTIAMFDCGPPIEELRRRCFDETGLPAPDPPRFTRSERG